MTAPVIPVAALKLGETNMKVTGEISFPLVLKFYLYEFYTSYCLSTNDLVLWLMLYRFNVLSSSREN